MITYKKQLKESSLLNNITGSQFDSKITESTGTEDMLVGSKKVRVPFSQVPNKQFSTRRGMHTNFSL